MDLLLCDLIGHFLDYLVFLQKDEFVSGASFIGKGLGLEKQECYSEGNWLRELTDETERQITNKEDRGVGLEAQGYTVMHRNIDEWWPQLVVEFRCELEESQWIKGLSICSDSSSCKAKGLH